MAQNPAQSPEKRPSPWISFGVWLTMPHPGLLKAVERRKARLASALSLVMILFTLTGGLATFRENPPNTLILVGLPVLFCLFAYILTRTRAYSTGSFLLVAGICAAAYWNILADGQDLLHSILIYVPLALTIGSALLTAGTLFLLTAMNLAAIYVISFLPGIPAAENSVTALGLVASFGVVLIVLDIFRQNIENQRVEEIQATNLELMETRQNLESRVEERTQALNRRSTQMEASAMVIRSTAAVHDLRELLENVVSQTADRFSYYHTGLFLLDTSEKYLILQAASSDEGKKQALEGFKLEFDRQSIAGNAAVLKRARIVQDVSTDPTYVRSLELPKTRSEAALPLLVRGQVIGVLDLHSENVDAFNIEDVYTLQTMADQIALAIDNTRLVESSRATLQQLEALNSANSAAVWKARLGEKRQGFVYTPLGVLPLAETSGPETGAEEKTIRVTLNLRGKSIGSLSLKRKSSDPAWAETEREMAERIASQVALAIENARLLEDFQQRVQREQTISEFSNRFSRSLDLDTLLQNAVRELQRLPQVSEVEVFISPEKDIDRPGQPPVMDK